MYVQGTLVSRNVLKPSCKRFILLSMNIFKDKHISDVSIDARSITIQRNDYNYGRRTNRKRGSP